MSCPEVWLVGETWLMFVGPLVWKTVHTVFKVCKQKVFILQFGSISKWSDGRRIHVIVGSVGKHRKFVAYVVL